MKRKPRKIKFYEWTWLDPQGQSGWFHAGDHKEEGLAKIKTVAALVETYEQNGLKVLRLAGSVIADGSESFGDENNVPEKLILTKKYIYTMEVGK